jgi:uncharacterized protein YjbI with pentapeptide repeats
VEADLTLAKITDAAMDGAVLTGATVWGANFYGSPVENAHGLEKGTGWIQDEGGVPRRDAPGVGLDRRGIMMEALRKSSGA